MIVNEQVHKESNTLFELTYNLQLHHACAWLYPKHICLTPLTFHTPVSNDPCACAQLYLFI